VGYYLDQARAASFQILSNSSIITLSDVHTLGADIAVKYTKKKTAKEKWIRG
jgi:hypothetical protein